MIYVEPSQEKRGNARAIWVYLVTILGCCVRVVCYVHTRVTMYTSVITELWAAVLQGYRVGIAKKGMWWFG